MLTLSVFAEVINGGIRQEYDANPKKKPEIQDVEPVYRTGAILAYNNGISFYNQQNYDKAIESFTEATRQEPRFGDAYFNLGLLYYSFDNIPEALMAFNKAYLSNKKDSEALLYMVKCYVEKNDIVAAKYYAAKIPKKSEFYKKGQECLKWKSIILLL